MCGWNKNGQLGLSSQEVDITRFSLIRNLPDKIIKLSCGWNHTMALSESAGVFVWGSNSFGQLGVPQVQKQSSYPLQLSAKVLV